MAELSVNITLQLFDPCFPQNHQGNTSKDIYEKIFETINGPLSAVIIIQGIIVNCIGLAAFFSHIEPRPNIYHYLIALCSWDIALLIISGFLCSFPTILFGGQLNSPTYIHTYPWWYYFGGVALVGCVWTISVLSCDRYLSICHPYRFPLLKKNTIIKMLVTVALSAAIYSSPRLFEITVEKCNNMRTNEIENVLGVTWLKIHPIYISVYKVAGGFLFISLVPYLLLLGLSIRISTELHRSATISSPATLTTSQRVDSSNKILMALMIKFLCCYLPTTVLDIWEAVVPGEHFFGNPLVRLMVASSNFLVAFNSGTNFWLYVIYSPLFRQACGQVLRGHFGQQKYSLKAAGIYLARIFDPNVVLIRSTRNESTSRYGTVVYIRTRRGTATFHKLQLP